MNDTPRSHPELAALAAICAEAAQRHGGDWHAVESHIRKLVYALPENERARLESVMDRVLRYRAPDAGGQTQ